MQTDVARKLSEIFSSAGQAFTHMAELTMQLHPTSGEASQQTSGKWTDKEVDMLKGAVERFGSDLDRIGSVIKNRTQEQIKNKAQPAKGNENVPIKPSVAQANAGVVGDKKSPASSSGPIIRKVANPSASSGGIAPPLVLSGSTSKPPVKEQKARRGGSSASKRANVPSASTDPQPVSASKAGPKLQSMLEGSKRQTEDASDDTEVKRMRTQQYSEYQRMKMLREVESDNEDSDDSDESDESDTTEDDDDDDDDDE